MLNEQLLTYVRENAKAGFKRSDIEAALKASGWDALDIAAAFSAITGAPAPQASTMTPSTSTLTDQQSVNAEVSRFRALNRQANIKKADPSETGIIGFMLRNNLASSKQVANIILVVSAIFIAVLAFWIAFR